MGTLADIDAETVRKILDGRRDPGSQLYRDYQVIRDKWDAIMRPEIEAIRATERLTAEDYAIRINVRDDDI